MNLLLTASSDPIVTAEKFIQYKKESGHISPHFVPPENVLVCYQQSTFKGLLSSGRKFEASPDYSDLYLTDNAAILAGWGIGSPALAIKLEELAALGVKRFIAVGTAGTLEKQPIGSFALSPKALAEDGVGHLYLPKDQPFAFADSQLIEEWNQFAALRALPEFPSVPAWSFSAIYRESPADIARVRALGCGLVEMEAAALFAIGKAKNVQTLSLFVISDCVSPESWTPRHKDPLVRDNLNQLASWALDFCQQQAK